MTSVPSLEVINSVDFCVILPQERLVKSQYFLLDVQQFQVASISSSDVALNSVLQYYCHNETGECYFKAHSIHVCRCRAYLHSILKMPMHDMPGNNFSLSVCSSVSENGTLESEGRSIYELRDSVLYRMNLFPFLQFVIRDDLR